MKELYTPASGEAVAHVLSRSRKVAGALFPAVHQAGGGFSHYVPLTKVEQLDLPDLVAHASPKAIAQSAGIALGLLAVGLAGRELEQWRRGARDSGGAFKNGADVTTANVSDAMSGPEERSAAQNLRREGAA